MTLVNSLQDRALTWYITNSNDNPNARIVDIQTALNREFSGPKSEVHSIIGLNEIMMIPGKTPWELDQRLKCTIHEDNMTLTDGRHCEWFVASLTPHLRNTLSQKRLTTQVEALEVAMKLHETPIQDPNLGVYQIHA